MTRAQSGPQTRIKFCGTLTLEEVRAAAELGIDMVGFVFAPSPRRVTPAVAAGIAGGAPKPGPQPVGVFVDPTLEEVREARGRIPGLAIQLSGGESPEFVAAVGGTTIKAIHVDPLGANERDLRAQSDRYPDSLLLFDTRVAGKAGGTGERFAWEALANLAREREIVVAGGLTPGNVAACVRAVRPFGVDVRSGIETNGVRDPAKMRQFAAAVREEDRRAHDA